MKTDNKGGPAFPCEVIGVDDHGEYRLPWQGMDLRDYFAAKAMQGLVAGAAHDEPINLHGAAEWSYNMADAMLEAREA